MKTKANDIPMAKASMLVAIASVTTTFNLVGSKQRLSSSALPLLLSQH